jgi:hypothetical protein
VVRYFTVGYGFVNKQNVAAQKLFELPIAAAELARKTGRPPPAMRMLVKQGEIVFPQSMFVVRVKAGVRSLHCIQAGTMN